MPVDEVHDAVRRGHVPGHDRFAPCYDEVVVKEEKQASAQEGTLERDRERCR